MSHVDVAISRPTTSAQSRTMLSRRFCYFRPGDALDGMIAESVLLHIMAEMPVLIDAKGEKSLAPNRIYPAVSPKAVIRPYHAGHAVE